MYDFDVYFTIGWASIVTGSLTVALFCNIRMENTRLVSAFCLNCSNYRIKNCSCRTSVLNVNYGPGVVAAAFAAALEACVNSRSAVNRTPAIFGCSAT